MTRGGSVCNGEQRPRTILDHHPGPIAPRPAPPKTTRQPPLPPPPPRRTRICSFGRHTWMSAARPCATCAPTIRSGGRCTTPTNAPWSACTRCAHRPLSRLRLQQCAAEALPAMDRLAALIARPARHPCISSLPSPLLDPPACARCPPPDAPHLARLPRAAGGHGRHHCDAPRVRPCAGGVARHPARPHLGAVPGEGARTRIKPGSCASQGGVAWHGPMLRLAPPGPAG